MIVNMSKITAFLLFSSINLEAPTFLWNLLMACLDSLAGPSINRVASKAIPRSSIALSDWCWSSVDTLVYGLQITSSNKVARKEAA